LSDGPRIGAATRGRSALHGAPGQDGTAIRRGNLFAASNTHVIKLTNVGTVGCHLVGYPRLSLLSKTGKVLPFPYRHGDQMITSSPPRRVNLQPAGTAFVGLNKSTCAKGGGVPAKFVRIAIGDKPVRLSLRRFPALEFCGTGEGFDKPVAVSPFGATQREAFAH
jgi:hypothetical protein